MNNKKIIFRVTREYMKQNKRRTLITFLGVLIMVVLMTAVFVGRDTVLRYMTDIISFDRGSWHAMVYDVDKNQADEIAALPYTDQVYVSRALGYTDFPASGKPEVTPYLELKSYSPEVFSLLNIRMHEGRFPENDNEIIISQLAVKDGARISIGDVIEIDAFDRYMHASSAGEDDHGFLKFSDGFQINHGDTLLLPAHFPFYYSNEDFEMIHESTGYRKTCTVVGIMESPYYELPGMGGYMAFTTADKTIADDEKVNLILTVYPDKPNDLNADLNRIVNETLTDKEREELSMSGTSTRTKNGEQIPVQEGRVEINDLLLIFAGRGTEGTFSMLLSFLQAFIILLITAASLILIYNVFSISFKERSHYLGMLSSIGATRSQKRWSVYYEIFLLLTLALPLGIGLGLLLVWGAAALLKPYVALIISMVAANAVTGRSVQIEPHLVIRPLALLLIALFSALAVWISAALPARNISRTGPLESIRGNDEYPKKPCRTLMRPMLKGRTEALLSSASVKRGRYSARGIIRSLTTLVVLVLITAFSAYTVCGIIRTKTDDSAIKTGSDYKDFEYLFEIGNESLYEEGREDIAFSDEVSQWKEFSYYFGGIQIRMEDLSEQYQKTFEQFLLAYFPDGITQEADQTLLHPTELSMNPTLDRLVVSSEDFQKIAKNAGIDLSSGSADQPGVIVYRPYAFDSDDYNIEYYGAQKPDYTRYELNEPLDAGPGNVLPLFLWNYDTNEIIDLPMTFLGYADASDIKEIAEISAGDVWLIISEQTNDWIVKKAESDYTGMDFRSIFLSPTTDDTNIIRRLSLMKDDLGNPALHSAEMITGMLDFKEALFMIIRIVAICFTFLITLMCLLNLWGSVMGRALARHREMAVLGSMGMTNRQRRNMLMREDILLLGRSIIPGGLISAGFMVLLHQVVSARFGHIAFHLPLWIVAAVLIVCAGSLYLFTFLCYRDRSGDTLIEEIRKESI